jgi:hypothetical protein
LPSYIHQQKAHPAKGGMGCVHLCRFAACFAANVMFLFKLVERRISFQSLKTLKRSFELFRLERANFPFPDEAGASRPDPVSFEQSSTGAPFPLFR